jgi:RNA polymerase sigma-70 factor (ECF subfamily)
MEDALAVAFRRHYRQIRDYVRRHGSLQDDPEEIAQEVFAQAAAALGGLRIGSSPLVAWLYTVAQRRIVDEARRRGRAARAELVVVPPAEASQYGDDVARSIRKALERLPDAQRRVVVLKLLEGRPFAEIARLLGTTEAASRMRFSRALERLRDQLEQEGITP